jgi:hypothetical protein
MRNPEAYENSLISEIDQILSGAPQNGQIQPPALMQDQQVLEIARQLSATDLSSRSRVRRSLRAHLLQSADPRKEWSPQNLQGVQRMKTRFAISILAVMALLIIAAAAVPPVRAFAQHLWETIGPITITNDPTTAQAALQAAGKPTPTALQITPTAIPGIHGAANEAAAQPTPRPGEGSGQTGESSGGPTPLPQVTDQRQRLSRTEALRQYGFDALEPAYLPRGYVAVDQPTLVRHPTGKMFSAHVYTAAGQSNSYLSIQQSTYTEADTTQFAVGDAQVSEVSLRGQKGTWIEQAKVLTVGDGKGNDHILPVNYLMWVENGSLFVIDSPELSQSELLKVAEGLK